MDGCFEPQQPGNVRNEEIYNFIQSELPKVELHAHLNGCIPMDLLRTLAQERNVTLSSKFNDWHSGSSRRNNRSLEDCFDIFRELPKVINDLSAIAQITRAALEQFAYHHSTIYLELRTTPKRLRNDHRDPADMTEKCTKRAYMETIIRTVQNFEETDRKRYEDECCNITIDGSKHDSDTNDPDQSLPRLPMTCRIIISVDRSQSIIEATENIDLAIALYQEMEEAYVVGVDLGGNPRQQDFGLFESLFQKARDAGLKVTIHCAEIECPSSFPDNHNDTDITATSSVVHSKEYKEIQRILRFRPDRIGHGVLLPKDLLLQLEELQIPVETCPTSNVLTLEMFHRDHAHQWDSINSNTDNNDEIEASLLVTNTTTQNSQFHYNSNKFTESAKKVQTIVHGLQNHHYTIQHWLKVRYPIIICTDDPGIFDTNITDELYIVYQAFQQKSSFCLLDLMQLLENSMNYTFCSETIRTNIKHQLQQRIRYVLNRHLQKRTLKTCETRNEKVKYGVDE
jgi:adenosine deaminase